ncbi:MAG: hypothetical protein MK193_10995, partial [Lentisphaeria bacterium]|nr:hypothetical protein [Lentisphaeria bacterium]
MLLKRFAFITSLLLCLSPFVYAEDSALHISGTLEKEWSTKGSVIWDAATTDKQIIWGTNKQMIKTIGFVDLLVSSTPGNITIEAQQVPTFTDSTGKVRKSPPTKRDTIDGTNAHGNGTFAMAKPIPFDHRIDGTPLGLKIVNEETPLGNSNRYSFQFMGIRFDNTPAGRLVFVYEMGNSKNDDTQWFVSDLDSPIPGAPWHPTDGYEDGPIPFTHLRKIVLLQLESFDDPRDRIPAKLTRNDITIDKDASDMTWKEINTWIFENINDETVTTERPFCILLPSGLIGNEMGELKASPYDKKSWGLATNKLTEGRKIWLIGNGETRIHNLNLLCSNIGVLFCRFGRSETEISHLPKNLSHTAFIELNYKIKNIDIRNNWLENPDGTLFGGIYLRSAKAFTILDNIISGTGAGISTPGNAELTQGVIARNWIARGFDGIQMYGGWRDVIIAYNHLSSAWGFPNREYMDPDHLGSPLHSDDFQIQANFSKIKVHRYQIFSNFSQYGP